MRACCVRLRGRGLAVGMFSTLPSIALIVGAICGTLRLGGMYGVALASVGMLSTLGVTLATDAYGPIVDNAGGIAEMADMPPEVGFVSAFFRLFFR